MAITATMALVAGALFAGTGVVQGQQARSEARRQSNIQAEETKIQGAEQRKQLEAQQRIADIRNSRERADFVRRAAFARAQVINQAALGGVSQASGPAGGVAGIDTAAATGLGGFAATQANQQDIFASQTTQSESIVRSGVAGAALTRAQVDISGAQALQSLGTTLFSAAGGFKSIFGPKK